MPYHDKTVAVIIPAFNEALSIASVVRELKELRAPHDPAIELIDDIIVSNNGSDDDTADLAQKAGASVFDEFRKGMYQT